MYQRESKVQEKKHNINYKLKQPVTIKNGNTQYTLICPDTNQKPGKTKSTNTSRYLPKTRRYIIHTGTSKKVNHTKDINTPSY